MTRKISALTARTQLGLIMTRAVENNDRFLVERNGEPAVLILSVADYLKTFAPRRTGSKSRGPQRSGRASTN